MALYVECVARNYLVSSPSHPFQNESHDGSSPSVLPLSHVATYISDKLTCRLNNVSDPKQTAPDGQTIEGRMQRLCEAAADDIKDCANACDAYLK